MFLVRQRRFGNTFFLRVLVRLRGGAETVRFRAGVREIEEFSTTSRRAVALADIDGDDAVDIVRVAGTTKGNVVRLYFNDGSGGFLSRRLEDGGTSPEEVALVDFDGDDLPELLTTFSSPPRLTLRRNLGDRQFGEPLALQSAGQPRTVLAEDLDQDGRVDLVILPENDSRPFFLWNQGNEAFERVPFERLPIETVDIDAADFDGDGRRDVVLRDESTIVLLRNRGGRTFEALDRLATGLQLSGPGGRRPRRGSTPRRRGLRLHTAERCDPAEPSGRTDAASSRPARAESRSGQAPVRPSPEVPPRRG